MVPVHSTAGQRKDSIQSHLSETRDFTCQVSSSPSQLAIKLGLSSRGKEEKEWCLQEGQEGLQDVVSLQEALGESSQGHSHSPNMAVHHLEALCNQLLLSVNAVKTCSALHQATLLAQTKVTSSFKFPLNLHILQGLQTQELHCFRLLFCKPVI